ncbi:uncharacterized protein LOC118423231 isoform X1 [Branchiostoma floridae]|uniref:Uncharacterized protein LOC118423231 isoform X1 n=1 Tax=Branchiostoma floridae TaxID=7739 RepID=A0A9J7LRG2_BRAFL|nr:uncharacterized protein LOC118423231 isoform X1 [Branchiostoma floridae]
MSDVECPSNEDSDEEKNEENLNIKEEPYDPDFDGPKHCARNTSFVAGQRTETTLGKSSLRDDPNRTSNTNNTGTTEAQGEQSASSGEALNSNTFPVLSKVKSEPGSEPEKYETVCAKPKAEPKTPDYNAILSSSPPYSVVDGNTDNRARPCRDGVQMVGGATPSIKQKTVEDNDDDDYDGCDTEIPSLSGEALNSNTFPVLSKVKSEPGSEPEKYETVCAKPKEKPNTPDYNNVILSCALLYSTMHGNTGNRAGPCSDGVQGVGGATPSIKQKTVEDNDDPTLCKAQKHHDDDDDGGCDTQPPSFGAECQDEEQAPFKRWTVTSSYLVPEREYKSHKTQTSLVRKNLDHGAQSSRRDKDEQDVNLSSMEAGSGASCDLHMSLGRVKRGHQESAVGVSKRQKQGKVTTLEGTIVKQKRDDKDNEEMSGSKVVSNNAMSMMCDLCSSTFASKILLENHQCREVVYFCKICSLESNRQCPPILMPLPEAERHFYLHFHPWLAGEKIESAVTTKDVTQIYPSKFGTSKLTRPSSQISFNFQCRLPEELQGKTLLINRKEVDLLKGIYIGTFLSKGDSQFQCGLCDANFSCMGGRAGHVSNVHLEKKNRNCGGTECEKISHSTFHHAKLLHHMFAAHCDLVMAPSPYLECKFCAMQFRDRRDLEWHFYHHMQPPVNLRSVRTDAEKSLLGLPPKSKDASGSMAQLKCTMCSYESVISAKVKLYTAAEARDHLAWHWLTQLPPEIRKSPNVLNFETDSDAIQCLYMIPLAPKAMITCEFCGQTFTANSTHAHMTYWHKDNYVTKPYHCMYPECKHLQFIRKRDFFGHMFSQHVSIIKRETFVFLCQICGKTFQNRSKVEWHCYVHRVRPAVSSSKGNAK